MLRNAIEHHRNYHDLMIVPIFYFAKKTLGSFNYWPHLLDLEVDLVSHLKPLLALSLDSFLFRDRSLSALLLQWLSSLTQ
jgi:hypothetical protein